MRAFVIADASKRKARPIGALFWQPDRKCKQGLFSLEIASWCTEADLPLSLSFCATRTNRCATNVESEQWVKSRIVPEDRHNIAEVLLAHGLTTYDEVSLLASCQGRSSDDDYRAFEVDLPDDIQQILATSFVDQNRNKTGTGHRANRKPTATRTDLLLDAVERTRRGPSIEYALVDLPPVQEGHERKSNRTHRRETAKTLSEGKVAAASCAAQHIGEKIRDARLACGLTQTQLAARAGITQVVLSRVESGKGNPTLSLLEEIAYALDTELDVSLK